MVGTYQALATAYLRRPNPETLSLLAPFTDVLDRFEIHQRNFRHALTAALRTRFSCSHALVGADGFRRAVNAFICESPPHHPCLDRYGHSFWNHFDEKSFVEFGRFEWLIGEVASQVDATALTSPPAGAWSESSPSAILQPGVRYVASMWALDALFSACVSGQSCTGTGDPEAVFLEIRGSEDCVTIQRLAPAEYAFRAALAGGLPLRQAILASLATASDRDPDELLSNVLTEQLVIGWTDREARA